MAPRARKAVEAASPDTRVEAFIARFDAPVAKIARACRSALRKRFPTAMEIVYDNYNALAIGFCSTERTSDCIVSLAVFPRGVSLSFYYGATLPDPQGLLEGSGNQNRFVRLDSAAALKKPAVDALLRAAVAQARTPLPKGEPGYTVIKSVSEQQRPRKPT